MKKNDYIKNDIVKLRKTFELLNDLEYNINFLKKYSEYLETLRRINEKEKIFIDYQTNLENEPFFYIEVFTIPVLKLIKEKKKILIKEYEGENFDTDINLIINNLFLLSKRIGCIGFKKQFTYTEEIFNIFLDNIKTTQKGNDLFIETDIMNIFHSIAYKIEIIKKQIKLNATPLREIDGLDVYKKVLTSLKLISNKDNTFSNSDNSKKQSSILGLLDEWIEKPIYTKEQMLGPVKIVQDKIDEIYGIDMVYLTPNIKAKNNEQEIREEIILKNLGLIIKGKYIKKIKTNDKKSLSQTESELIYFLYDKYKQNPNECFKIGDLAKIFRKEKGEKTMRNMITSINNKVKKIIGPHKNIKIERIIIRAKKESYNLNSKIII